MGEMTGQIKIDDGIPMPTTYSTSAKYPWKELEVGQSFLFPPDTLTTTAHSSAQKASLTHAPKKFATRKTPEGYRCWRTA